ncbi:MAG: hypothetical protein AVDCRST_MAG93-1079 [uncultured Chloroflexia bacterium]|uniref:Uncharacterized protein n=1 Tax=uncultured Chloroflexia bacterium TaxID=1672391 RepID=A0A6J4HYM3_9CHLR|nr:MAG: hypothetical protein AVDCRST_MAG93-1079 [uncultured Chloroflexia bacterium]
MRFDLNLEIPPPPPPDDEDRYLQCLLAIELPLQDIVEAAVEAGWKDAEILSAMIEVADNLMLATGANDELAGLLKALKRPK